MAGDEPLLTDGGHYIVDCHFDGGIDDAVKTATYLRARAGVVLRPAGSKGPCTSIWFRPITASWVTL